MDGAAKPGMLKRLLPCIVLLAVVAAFFALGLHRTVSLDALRAHRAMLLAAVAENRMMAMAGFVALYVLAVAASLPGAVVLSLAGGFLFGVAAGAALIVVGATAGATVLFVVARTAFGDVLRSRAGPFVRRMEDGFRENAFWYLLSLRLIPIFPFFAVNLVPALIGVPLGTFVAATLIGIVPGTVVFASFGAGLGEVFDRGGEVSVGAVLTPGIVAGLVGLGVLSLIPVAVKRWRGR